MINIGFQYFGTDRLSDPITQSLAIPLGYEGISTALEYGGPILRVRFDF